MRPIDADDLMKRIELRIGADWASVADVVACAEIITSPTLNLTGDEAFNLMAQELDNAYSALRQANLQTTMLRNRLKEVGSNASDK